MEVLELREGIKSPELSAEVVTLVGKGIRALEHSAGA